MNRNEIRKHTCIIIRRNGEYLLGKKWMTEDLLWTWSAYDAWRTRDREAAEAVARVLGGEMVLFNPVIGKTKLIGT